MVSQVTHEINHHSLVTPVFYLCLTEIIRDSEMYKERDQSSMYITEKLESILKPPNK